MPENGTHCSCLSTFCGNSYKKIKGCSKVSVTTPGGTKESCLCQGASGQGKRRSSRMEKEKFRGKCNFALLFHLLMQFIILYHLLDY
ncbi:hypothetical protein TNIN_390691 [Trichonephila inaurata madagascariensis]|uniref:Uncharacterized protein n=1 Tax=Trichonephila inaurata madagascariensis TaxID=2747483 RepID=A0A8X6X5V5_9ARAC|nr:hypothetical protein TNIN_390691 [Trichonephila inaurata madagascariensis]